MLVNTTRFSFLLVLFALGSCQSLPPTKADFVPSIENSNSRLSSKQKQKIARKIWQNESGGTIKGLTAWNVGEEFPSFGIGHFIWYPSGMKGPFEESFPQFIDYAYRSGRRDIPKWVSKSRNCPWNTRDSFLGNFNGPELTELRSFLRDSTEVQADFIIARSRAALPKILATAQPSERQRIRTNYERVASTPQGTYALIDYVNFKGSGIKASERYRGQGWGLLQVLSNMQQAPDGPPAAREFANSAKRTLSQRIKNSPQARGERRWEAGWHNRCETYAQPL